MAGTFIATHRYPAPLAAILPQAPTVTCGLPVREGLQESRCMDSKPTARQTAFAMLHLHLSSRTAPAFYMRQACPWVLVEWALDALARSIPMCQSMQQTSGAPMSPSSIIPDSGGC